MVDRDYVQSQLRKIEFLGSRFNRAEIAELENILLDDEKIYECVNGVYEGGVALLVATDIRVLLIDKKPMGFLNVDDMRFDMISDIDYSHRIFGAQININCGSRNLSFKSYNQSRLRKAIGHIQERISEIKKEQYEHANTQKKHLEDINRQLQIYLLAQQQQLERQLARGQSITLPKPNPQLADYLFAQRLLEDFQGRDNPLKPDQAETASRVQPGMSNESLPVSSERKLLKEMEEAGRREVLGMTPEKKTHSAFRTSTKNSANSKEPALDVTPFKIAYAKLPYLLRSRRYNPGNSSY